MHRKSLLATGTGIVLLTLGLLWQNAGFRTSSAADTTPGPSGPPSHCLACPTVTPTPSPTTNPITQCPKATPEPFWVEPVTSPTWHLTQTIVVFLGNGEAVTVTCESGTFTQQGPFGAHNRPARIVIDLLPDTDHHLEVTGKVRITGSYNGCIYGGYTLRIGPLLIQQRSLVPVIWLPLVLRARP